jgi:hypothetical protein
MKNDLIILFMDTKNRNWNEKRFHLNILKKVYNVRILYFNEASFKNYNLFNIKNFINFKRGLKNPIFLNFLIENKKNYIIYNVLKTNNCKQIYVYSLKPKFKSKSVINYLNKYYLSFFIKLFFKRFSSFFTFEKKNTFDYDYYVTNDMNIPKNKLIKMHELNYYQFLKNKNKDQIKKNFNQVVFIDDAPNNHPDFAKLNLLPQLIDVKNYKKRLIEVFNQFERYFDIRVVVAGHPRLKNSPSYKKNFGKFKVIFGQTDTLIASAKYIIAHDSTSINLAILYKKPILLLNSKSFYHHYQNQIKNMSNLTGSKHFYLENKLIKKNLCPRSSTNRYNKYINTFLKCKLLDSTKPWDDFLSKF